MQFPSKHPFQFLITALILINTSYAQSASDYLKLLEGEASNSSVDVKTHAKQKKNAAANSSALPVDGVIPIGLSLEDFMQNLKLNFIGSYFFAKRLSTQQQSELYTFYQNNNNPQAIRTQIIKISKQK